MLKHSQSGDEITVYLTGELDHFAAQTLRVQIEALIEPSEIRKLKLDFSEVTFMDSSGVGMLIGRYKSMKARDGSVHAIGLRPTTEKLFRMAGLHRIIEIEDSGREENQ